MSSDHGRSPSAPSTAGYIASFADELSRLAKSEGLDSLAYILEMARLEADQISKNPVSVANNQAPERGN